MIMRARMAVLLALISTWTATAKEHLLYDLASQGSRGWTGVSHQDNTKLRFAGNMEWREEVDGPVSFIMCPVVGSERGRQYLRSPLINWKKNSQISVIVSNVTEWRWPDLTADEARKRANCTALTLMYGELNPNGVVYDSKLVEVAKLNSGGFHVNVTTHQSGGQLVLFARGCGCLVIGNFSVYVHVSSNVNLSVLVWDRFQIGLAVGLGLLVCAFAMAITMYIKREKKVVGSATALSDLLRLSVQQFNADLELKRPESDCRREAQQPLSQDKKTEDVKEIGEWLDNMGFYCYYPLFLDWNIKSWQDVFDLTYSKLSHMGIKAEHQSIILLNTTVLKSRRRFYTTPWYAYF